MYKMDYKTTIVNNKVVYYPEFSMTLLSFRVLFDVNGDRFHQFILCDSFKELIDFIDEDYVICIEKINL